MNSFWLYLFFRLFMHSRCSVLCHNLHSSRATVRISFSPARQFPRTLSSLTVLSPRSFLMKNTREQTRTEGEYFWNPISKAVAQRRYLPSQQSFSDRTEWCCSSLKQRRGEGEDRRSKPTVVSTFPSMARMSGTVQAESQMQTRFSTLGIWQVSWNLAAIHSAVMPRSWSLLRVRGCRRRQASMILTVRKKVSSISLYFWFTSTSQFSKTPRMCSLRSGCVGKQLGWGRAGGAWQSRQSSMSARQTSSWERAGGCGLDRGGRGRLGWWFSSMRVGSSCPWILASLQNFIPYND